VVAADAAAGAHAGAPCGGLKAPSPSNILV
jgi:hypothetical protein